VENFPNLRPHQFECRRDAIVSGTVTPSAGIFQLVFISRTSRRSSPSTFLM